MAHVFKTNTKNKCNSARNVTIKDTTNPDTYDIQIPVTNQASYSFSFQVPNVYINIILTTFSSHEDFFPTFLGIGLSRQKKPYGK